MATFTTTARTLSELATTVRDARLVAGMSQADLAAAARLNRSWVSLFESGHTPNASLSKVLAMLDALGVTVRLAYTVPETDAPPGDHKEDADRVDSDHADSDRVDPDRAGTDPGDLLPPVPRALDPAALAAARAQRAEHRARARGELTTPVGRPPR